MQHQGQKHLLAAAQGKYEYDHRKKYWKAYVNFVANINRNKDEKHFSFGPCTLMMTDLYRTLMERKIGAVTIQNAAQTAGCTCYVRSALANGYKVFKFYGDDEREEDPVAWNGEAGSCDVGGLLRIVRS